MRNNRGTREVVGVFVLTNEKNKTIRRSLRSTRPIWTEELHATNDRADEVDIEN